MKKDLAYLFLTQGKKIGIDREDLELGASNMKVKWYETRKRWRLIVPARFTGTGKKQFMLFKSKSEGEAEIRRIY